MKSPKQTPQVVPITITTPKQTPQVVNLQIYNADEWDQIKDLTKEELLERAAQLRMGTAQKRK